MNYISAEISSIAPMTRTLCTDAVTMNYRQKQHAGATTNSWLATMGILISAIFSFLFLVSSANADQTDSETIKAIGAARKDFQGRTIAMYPSTGEYSALRQLGSYSMSIAETPTKIIVVFLVDKRLGFVGGGGEYTLSKKDAQILSFQGYE